MIKVLKSNELNNEIAVVVGTRPGIIKFSPVIRELQNRNIPFFIIHTGQHYSYNMDRIFFKDLELPEPRYFNDTVRKKKSHGSQTAEMIVNVEKVLLESRPRLVIVGGDANTNFAAAIATRKLVNIVLAHMEAGLRSNDWRMPEEHNRIMIDHISEILFCPTEINKKNLIKDNVKGHVIVTGNTIVDAVSQNLEIAKKKSKILYSLGINRNKQFSVLTLHREENVDSPKLLRKHVKNIEYIANNFEGEVIFPMHPRTKLRLEEFELLPLLKSLAGLRLMEPVGYLDMLVLMKKALFIMTDSGGIQEEACIVGTPCITLRDSTERPETVTVGSNKVVGTSGELLKNSLDYFMSNPNLQWENPYGDGKAAERIVKYMVNFEKDLDNI